MRRRYIESDTASDSPPSHKSSHKSNRETEPETELSEIPIEHKSTCGSTTTLGAWVVVPPRVLERSVRHGLANFLSPTLDNVTNFQVSYSSFLGGLVHGQDKTTLVVIIQLSARRLTETQAFAGIRIAEK